MRYSEYWRKSHQGWLNKQAQEQNPSNNSKKISLFTCKSCKACTIAFQIACKGLISLRLLEFHADVYIAASKIITVILYQQYFV